MIDIAAKKATLTGAAKKTIFCWLLEKVFGENINLWFFQERQMNQLKSIVVLGPAEVRQRRLSLQQKVSDLIAFLEENDYSFAEILKAMSDHAAREIGKMPSEKTSWEVASAMLEVSANRVMLILDCPSIRSKCNYLQEIVTDFANRIQGEEYTFSEVLLALSRHSREQGGKALASDQLAWREVVLLLNLAAQQTQVEGRELP